MSFSSSDQEEKTRKDQDDYSLYFPIIRQLHSKPPYNTRRSTVVEDVKSGNLINKSNYLLTAIGFLVFVDDDRAWKLPFLVSQHGGIAFFIPYLTVYIVSALPLILSEMLLRLMSSVTKNSIEDSGLRLATALMIKIALQICKILGYFLLIYSGLSAIFYHIIPRWSLFHVINSFDFSLPWSNCANVGKECTLEKRMKCNELNGTLFVNGSSTMTLNISNVISQHDIESIPNLKHFHNDIIMLSKGVDDFGTLNWYLGLCVLVCWIAVFLCLFQNVKSSKKVVYVSVILPFIIILVLLTRLLTLDGSFAAVLYFMKPNWEVLKDREVWETAGYQAFYNVAGCTVGLVTIGNGNRFPKDMGIVYFTNIIGMLIGCLFTFSAIGFTCYGLSIDLSSLHINDGFDLIFVSLSDSLSRIPSAPLFIGLLFIMALIVVCFTQMFVIETIATFVIDKYPSQLRTNRNSFRVAVSIILLYISIIFFALAGSDWMDMLKQFVADHMTTCCYRYESIVVD